MTNEYEKLRAEWKEYFAKAQDAGRWLRLISSSGNALHGKVRMVGKNIAYLNPSLVYEEGNEKRMAGFKLEDKLDTTICLGNIQYAQPLTQDYVDSLLNKDSLKKNKTGFGQEDQKAD